MHVKHKKLFIFTLVSIIVILSLRFVWYSYHTDDEISVTVDHGVLDLTQYESLENKTFTLSGDWLFTPDEFVDPTSPLQQEGSLPFAQTWSSYVAEEMGVYGKASYQLIIRLPVELDHPLAFRFHEIFSAASFYVNGQLVYEYNELDHTFSDQGLIRGPVQVDVFDAASIAGELHLVAHVANYQFPQHGGITGSVHFGDKSVIDGQASLAYTMQVVVAFIFMLHALYAITLFVMTRSEQRQNLLLFAIILILFGSGILIDDDVIIQLPLTILDANRLLLIIFISTLFTMFKLSSNIFQLHCKYKILPWALYVGACFNTLLFPAMNFGLWVAVISATIFGLACFMIYKSIKTITAGNGNSYFILLFILAYLSNSVWGLLIKVNLLQMPFYPLDFLFSMIFIMILFFKQHAETVEENKRKTERIAENELKKDEFLATTAHELRNPLHGIIVILESVLSSTRSDLSVKTSKDLVLILEIAQNMKYTLEDLQDISRLKDHEITLNLTNVNLPRIVSNVVEVFQLRTNGKAVKIVNEISSDVPYVKADAQRLFQVIFNLVNNAFKFTFKGYIHIRAEQLNGKIKVFVHDTGIGIPQHNLPKITHPYERGSNVAKSYGQGVGLGLSISKQLIDLHGGEFLIESEVDEGTTVSFTIAIADAQNEAVPEQTYRMIEHRSSLSKRQEDEFDATYSHEKIIVIDDDPINLTAIEMALTPDYELTIIDDPTQLFALNDLYDYALVISDVMMPQMSGFDVTRKLREQFSITDLPVLLLTALNHPSNVATGFVAGANDYMSKPVDRTVLRSKVHTLVHLRHAVKEKIAAEAAWLQAQIKPHFLFNTLNSIASLGETDTNEMAELIQQFGTYLRRSFNILSTSELVPLEDEIETVKSYLYIQYLRFPDRFTVNWNIRTTDRIMIPPFVLQTIVENAIEHGVLQTPATFGEIDIVVKCSEDRALVSIQDNGPGICEQELEFILSGGRLGGIGLRNSNQRLKLINQAGLKIESIEPHGTKVSFDLPIV